MHPTIFSLGPFAIRSYGLMLALGFMAGIMFAAYRARKAGENPDHVYNLSVWLILSALVGARLYYVASHFDEFRVTGDIPAINRILIELRNIFWPVGQNGVVGINGLVLYGGFILATITAVIYLARHRLNIPRFLDILAPSLGIGIFFTRIGCFLTGCCFGRPTELPIGVQFPLDSAAGTYFPHTHLYPSQLFQSAMGLAIFGLLLWLERYKRFDGFLALWFFMLYAVARFVADFFRYYESDLVWFGLSHNQIISIAIFFAVGGLLIYLSRTRSRNGRAGSTSGRSG